MSKILKEESRILSNNLQEIEDQLVKFFTEVGQIKWNSEIISKLAGYLYIHGSLTQNQLKSLTGYALSTISVNLNTLLNLGLMKKLIPGTHTFEYYFPSDFNKSLSKASQTRKEEMEEIYKFIQNILEEIDSLKNQDFELVKYLSGRLRQFLLIINTFRSLINRSNEKKVEKDKSIKPENRLNLQKIPRFTSEIIEIEDKIISFIVNWKFLRRMGAPSPLILGYFITRGHLTQEKLRKITSFSVAKIYKELNKLIEFGIIEKVKESKSRRITYSMARIDVAFVNYMIKNTKKILDWEDKFKNINFYLKSNKTQLLNTEGYKRIQYWVKVLLKLIRSYNKRLLYLEILIKDFNL